MFNSEVNRLFSEFSEERDYWVGFIMADGHIIQPKSPNAQMALQITLSSKDKDHLQKLKEFLNVDAKIREYNFHHKKYDRIYKACSIRITSDSLCRELRRLGVKGKDSAPAPELRKSRHFWRGFVDGDGTLYIRQDTKKGRLVLNIVGTSTILNQCLTFIQEQAPRFKGQVRKEANIFKISTSSSTAMVIASYLYDNSSVSLTRKHRVYLNKKGVENAI